MTSSLLKKSETVKADGEELMSSAGFFVAFWHVILKSMTCMSFLSGEIYKAIRLMKTPDVLKLNKALLHWNRNWFGFTYS